jgi:type IV pilus assembly protein PilB
VYQTLPIDDEIRSALVSDKGVDTVREIARRAGMRDLREVALERVRANLTTIEEVDRVLPEGAQTVAT